MISNEPQVWINGCLYSLGQARVSPHDLGFTVAHGAFETLRVYNGHPFATTRHWKRLCESCMILGIHNPSQIDFHSSMIETIKSNPFLDARVRYTVTAGEGQNGLIANENNTTIVVSVFPLPSYEMGADVVSSTWPRNERSPLSRAKSLSYAENLIALGHARLKGADEVLFSNTAGNLCEGATSNVFIVRGQKLFTPPLTAGCLPGVTRGLVIELARENGMEVAEIDIPMNEVSTADEIFLTSSTREIQTVARVDGKTISHPADSPGLQLAQLLKRLVSENSDP